MSLRELFVQEPTITCETAGVRGTGGQRFQSAEVEVDDAVILGVGIGGEFNPVLLAAFGAQKFAGGLIGGEDGGSHAEFRAHVGDGCTLGDAQRGDSGTEIFRRPADVAVAAQNLQHLQDDVLGADPRWQLSAQSDAHDLGEFQFEGLACHGQGDVQSASADGEHADSAARRGVGIGAEQRLAGDAVAFQMNLVADAIAGPRVQDAVGRADALQVQVVIGIFRPHLSRVMVNVLDG